ncbi:MAG: hypothetical protein IJ794_15170 [Lachnospiraceae bacterium]|nr:hypothetical protein [Lachnospiraceae bacterium]
MENNASEKINTFDSLFTTDHIRMLKILLSQMNPPLQGKFAVYIRFLELSYTMRFFSQNPFAGWSSAGLSLFAASKEDSPLSGNVSDVLQVIEEILPFCDFAERKTIQSLKSTLQSVENIQQTLEMFQMMQELFPDMFRSATPDGTPENASSPNAGTPFGMDFSQISQMLDMMQGFQMFGTDEKS